MSESIRDLLSSLYSETQVAGILRRLQLTERPRTSRSARAVRQPLPLTERDVLLITYGDQIRAPGQSLLQALAGFMHEHLTPLVSGVHLLPFFPYSSDDGFSVIDYYAVDPALGTWEDIARLGADFDLMFDLVANHISSQSAWFQRFLSSDQAYRGYFIEIEGSPDLSLVIRPRALPLLTAFISASGEKKVWTTFSADQIDLDYHNPEVLIRMLDILLFYVSQGARLIRLDAIAFLWKELGTTCLHLPQTHAIVRLMRAVLDEIAPGVLLITETNVPHSDNLSYLGDGNSEAQLVYNFALPPLVLHSIHTGDASALSHWAQTLVLPSENVTFFNFLASHDGIGLNPARGILRDAEVDALVTRAREHGGLVSYKHNPDGTKSPYELNITLFDALSNPFAAEARETRINRFMTAQAIMLALQGMPGIYFHSLFGLHNDKAGVERSGQPRRINRQKHTRAELEERLATPGSLQREVFARYAELLRVRRANPAFHPLAGQEILDLDPSVFAIRRTTRDKDASVLCLHNVSNHAISVDPGIAPGSSDLLGAPALDQTTRRAINLGPYEIRWLATKSDANR